MVTSASEQDRIIKDQIYPLSEEKKKNNNLKKQTKHFGISLTVQWLQIHAANAESPGSVRVREIGPVCDDQDLAQSNKLTFNKNWISFSDVQ